MLPNYVALPILARYRSSSKSICYSNSYTKPCCFYYIRTSMKQSWKQAEQHGPVGFSTNANSSAEKTASIVRWSPAGDAHFCVLQELLGVSSCPTMCTYLHLAIPHTHDKCWLWQWKPTNLYLHRAKRTENAIWQNLTPTYVKGKGKYPLWASDVVGSASVRMLICSFRSVCTAKRCPDCEFDL